jgi:hypothetical protein
MNSTDRGSAPVTVTVCALFLLPSRPVPGQVTLRSVTSTVPRHNSVTHPFRPRQGDRDSPRNFGNDDCLNVTESAGYKKGTCPHSGQWTCFIFQPLNYAEPNHITSSTGSVSIHSFGIWPAIITLGYRMYRGFLLVSFRCSIKINGKWERGGMLRNSTLQHPLSPFIVHSNPST